MVNEIISWASKKKKRPFLLKVDFEKAFDSVDWAFLDNVMKQMGFSQKWRKWISGCLGSAYSSVLVNESPTKEFKIEKGLRQGDPLSPFLVIIAMESLHVTLEDAKLKNIFEGVKVGSNNKRNLRSGQELDELDTIMGLLQHHCPSPIDDRYDFTLHHSNIYFVSVMRKYIDSRSLLTEGIKTGWNKLVPIKINILAWINDRLPTRSNLDSRGIELHSLLCPICDDSIEYAQHLFLHCNLAYDVWSSVFKW
ncbi:RNA-directed DNA polymerase, eukaryota, reverse transcriptase zinc-binding domain protein [Tanacetum coccineum]